MKKFSLTLALFSCLIFASSKPTIACTSNSDGIREFDKKMWKSIIAVKINKVDQLKNGWRAEYTIVKNIKGDYIPKSKEIINLNLPGMCGHKLNPDYGSLWIIYLNNIETESGIRIPLNEAYPEDIEEVKR